MVFKKLFWILQFLVLAACGQGSAGKMGVIGEVLQDYSLPSISSKSFTKDSFWYFDSVYNIIQNFDFKKQKTSYLIESRIAAGEPRQIISDENDRFIIELSKKKLNIYILAQQAEESDLEGGQSPGAIDVIENPIRLVGNPLAVAYDPSSRIFAFTDDIGSIGLMELSEEGRVSRSWVGGAGISETERIMCGDLDDRGSLILGLSSGAVVAADVNEVLQLKSWRSSPILFAAGTFTPESPLNWIAPIESSSWVMAATESSAYLFSQNRKETDPIQKYPLDSGIKHFSKGLVPHVLFQDKQKIEVLYPEKVQNPSVDAPENWEFKDRELSLNLGSDVQVKASVFDPEGSSGARQLAVQLFNLPVSYGSQRQRSGIYNPAKESRYLSLRLSDLLVLKDETHSQDIESAFNKNWFFGWKVGGLGYVRATPIGETATEDQPYEKKAFLLEYLRSK